MNVVPAFRTEDPADCRAVQDSFAGVQPVVLSDSEVCGAAPLAFPARHHHDGFAQLSSVGLRFFILGLRRQ